MTTSMIETCGDCGGVGAGGTRSRSIASVPFPRLAPDGDDSRAVGTEVNDGDAQLVNGCIRDETTGEVSD